MRKPEGLTTLSSDQPGTITLEEYRKLRASPQADVHVVLPQPRGKGEVA